MLDSALTAIQTLQLFGEGQLSGPILNSIWNTAAETFASEEHVTVTLLWWMAATASQDLRNSVNIATTNSL